MLILATVNMLSNLPSKEDLREWIPGAPGFVVALTSRTVVVGFVVALTVAVASVRIIAKLVITEVRNECVCVHD